MTKPNEPDWSSISLRTITPEQWDAAKREIARGAREDRTRMMRELFQRLRRWLRTRKRPRHSLAQAHDTLQTRPLHWSGRA